MSQNTKAALTLVLHPISLTINVPSAPRDLSFTLKNPSVKPLAYKFRCTDEDRYKVCPVFGIVSPGSSARLHIRVSAIRGKPIGTDYLCLSEADPGKESDAYKLWLKGPVFKAKLIKILYNEDPKAKLYDGPPKYPGFQFPRLMD